MANTSKASKTATKVETKKVEAKKAETKVVAPVATVAPATTATTTTDTKKEVAPKAATTKKAPAKKDAAKTAAPKNELYVQFAGFEFSYDELLEKVKADYAVQTGKKTITSTQLYVKPEDMKVYYVINGKFMGDVYLG